jgi:adenylate cyclase
MQDAVGVTWETRLRLWSGLVLFTFVVTHFLNHALGIVAYEWMEAGRVVFVGVWRSVPGTALLLGAALTHAGLGIAKVLRLPSLRMPRWEFAQAALGLSIPMLLAPHLVGTIIGHLVVGYEDSYALELMGLWSSIGIIQAAVLLVIWVHGCVGIHFWLRIRPAYSVFAPWLLGLAVVLPLLALMGFVDGARQVQAHLAEPAWVAAKAAGEHWPDAQTYHRVVFAAFGALGAVALLTGALLSLRLVLPTLRRRSALVEITYPGGRRVVIPYGVSVLEASRLAGIPHASVCGGRGRCSTCRVRIDAAADVLDPPGAAERQILRRVHAPPNVRLACQARPAGPLMVTPLLPPHAEPRDAYRHGPFRYGQELEIAILFSDLRGFTSMTERRLAYDVVFLMNSYFRTMGETIERHHGHLVQVFGDGIMALFGIGSGVALGSRMALSTARSMAVQLDELNRVHGAILGEPLRMGIGIHSGRVIVGEMGYHDAVILTAVGDAVNTTSRLQESTKLYDCQLVVSAAAAQSAGIDLGQWPARELEVRGRSRPLAVHPVPLAHDLPDLPDSSRLAATDERSPLR